MLLAMTIQVGHLQRILMSEPVHLLIYRNTLTNSKRKEIKTMSDNNNNVLLEKLSSATGTYPYTSAL